MCFLLTKKAESFVQESSKSSEDVSSDNAETGITNSLKRESKS